MKVHKDNLWINNWGKIQYINVAKMKKTGSVDISWIPTIFERDDKSFAAEPMGEFIIENDSLHVCAKISRTKIIKPSTPTSELYKIANISSYK
jgi:hypothetical protein